MRERARGFIVLVVLLLLALVAVIVAKSRPNFGANSGTLAKVSQLYPIDTIKIAQEKKAVKYRNYKVLNLNLNRASSEELISVYGIGKVFARRIIEYRTALGGYYCVEQLKEVRGIDNDVYEKIFRNFYVLDDSYSKISINFASPRVLREHPYFTPTMVKRIDEARKRGGYFTNLEELKDYDILLPSEALRVAPYLSYEGDKTTKIENK